METFTTTLLMTAVCRRLSWDRTGLDFNLQPS